MSLEKYETPADRVRTERDILLRIMSGKGDVKVLFDPKNKADVAMATAAFTNAKAAGMLGYTIHTDGGSEVITDLSQALGDEEDVKEVVLTPNLQGG